MKKSVRFIKKRGQNMSVAAQVMVMVVEIAVRVLVVHKVNIIIYVNNSTTQY